MDFYKLASHKVFTAYLEMSFHLDASWGWMSYVIYISDIKWQSLLSGKADRRPACEWWLRRHTRLDVSPSKLSFVLWGVIEECQLFVTTGHGSLWAGKELDELGWCQTKHKGKKCGQAYRGSKPEIRLHITKEMPFPGKGWSFLKCIARLFWLIFLIAHEMVNDFCHCVCYFKNFIYRLV